MMIYIMYDIRIISYFTVRPVVLLQSSYKAIIFSTNSRDENAKKKRRKTGKYITANKANISLLLCTEVKY